MKNANTTSYKERLSEHIDAYLSLVTSHPKVRQASMPIKCLLLIGVWRILTIVITTLSLH